MKTFALCALAAVTATAAFGQYADDYTRARGKFSLCVKGGPSFPVTEFANSFKTGFTGFADLSYNVTPDFHLYVGVGFSRFELDNAGFSDELGKTYPDIQTSVTAPYQVIPVVLGLNISHAYPHFWPYFTLSVGAYFQKLETSGSFVYNGVTTQLTPKTQTWTQSAYAIGLGSLIPIGDAGWAVDVNVKFNSVVDYDGRVLITAPDGSDVSTRAIRYVSALAGLCYTFQ